MPHHVQRYSSLTAVDISDESFQELTAGPPHHHAPSSTHQHATSDKGPCLSSLYPSIVRLLDVSEHTSYCTTVDILKHKVM